ncbi:rCG61643 [Rattus norvegicus]|uniref:RCG61643 n=1 Tax=Rattus norvegicus TaxID=10116 RepID=A6H9E5_RAT|nr:rCG61643 [Rattus norvegicus]
MCQTMPDQQLCGESMKHAKNIPQQYFLCSEPLGGPRTSLVSKGCSEPPSLQIGEAPTQQCSVYRAEEAKDQQS